MFLRDAFIKRRDEPQGYVAILRVCLPLVAGMASSTIMLFTNRLFLSHYSVDTIAAAMPAGIAAMTILFTLTGVCGYTSVLVAQYVGSDAPKRVGSALWQGIWSVVAGTVLLCLCYYLAKPLFALAGHDPHLQELEVTYFRILTMGSGFSLLASTLAGFFSGRGQTRPVMIANMAACCIKVPLDYILIFGCFGLPAMGIAGAGIATVTGWAVTAAILAAGIFQRKHEERYAVFSGFPFEWNMFRRLLRYGLPSGVNFFVEMLAVTWFLFEVGEFGREALAASNMAFSLNSLTFMPMIGLNMGLATLVGQAMGRGKPADAERLTANTLHISFAYMLPLSLLIAIFAGPLMDLFAPGDLSPQEFAPVRELGVVLLYFIAVYSLVDSCNIVFFGALKGAGDTFGIMCLLTGSAVFFIAVPILILKWLGMASVISYWLVFTAYVILLALAAMLRFNRRRWHTIRVVETALPQSVE